MRLKNTPESDRPDQQHHRVPGHLYRLGRRKPGARNSVLLCRTRVSITYPVGTLGDFVDLEFERVDPEVVKRTAEVRGMVEEVMGAMKENGRGVV